MRRTLARDFVIDIARLCAVLHGVTYHIVEKHSSRLQRKHKGITSCLSQCRDNSLMEVSNDLLLSLPALREVLDI